MRALPRVVVLLEGQSDVAAVRALLGAHGALDGDGVELVDMGGVTNVRRHLVGLVTAGGPRPDATTPTRVLGLGDVAEAPYLARALAAVGRPVGTLDDMATLGFHVCDRDLEDELVRALGAARVQEVLAGLGLLERFLAFQRQLAWHARPVEHQLRRFAGTTSGRKVLVAEALASALPDAQVPAPLAALVAQIRESTADDTPGPAVRPFT